MGKDLDIDELLAHLPLFAGMDASVREKLAKAALQIRVTKKTTIFHKGDHAQGLYIVAVGHIKISLPSTRGREKIIEFVEAGRAFGEAVMFLEHPYLNDAQALTDSLLIWIDKRDIDTAIESDPLFARIIIKGLSQRFENLMRDIETVHLSTAFERVVRYLLGQPHQEMHTALIVNKRMIASKLGLTPETFSRVLKQLIQQELITVKGSTVCIHGRSELENMIQSATQPCINHMLNPTLKLPGGICLTEQFVPAQGLVQSGIGSRQAVANRINSGLNAI